MGFLIFLGGFVAGLITLYMWKVPAEDLTKPVCLLCNGSGHTTKYDRWRLR
jgi:hypothetical protein